MVTVEAEAEAEAEAAAAASAADQGRLLLVNVQDTSIPATEAETVIREAEEEVNVILLKQVQEELVKLNLEQLEVEWMAGD